MATYVNDLRLKEIATGDEAGTWGTSTNTNLELIGEALGYGTQDCFSTDADATTTVADGATDPARAMYFKVTSSATLTATRTLTIAPNTISRVMFIENATTGSQSINISQGSGANVTIATGKTVVVYLDGAGSGAAVVDAMALVDPGVTDTLAEVLVAGNTSGGTGLTMSSGDDLTLTGANYNAVWDSSADALEFGDNAKAVFGTGSDLQIYHDGSNSFVDDNGVGNLFIRSVNGDSVRLYSGGGASSNLRLLANSAGELSLYHSGSKKLDTTSTGIDVTGTAVTDGVTIDGSLTFQDDASFPTTGLVLNANTYLYQRGGSGGIIFSDASGTNEISRFTGSTVTFNEDGRDADFRVESDGASHMLFVNAGANRVGIGESNPQYTLHATSSGTTLTRLESTDAGTAYGPYLDLRRTSASPIDGDGLGIIVFTGQDSGGNGTTYAQIRAEASDVTDGTEDGLLSIRTIKAGTDTARVNINQDATVFNEGSVDVDFRVESDASANMLVVDAAENKVGINRTPNISNSKLEVGGADNVPIFNVEASGYTGGLGIGAAGLQLFHGSSSKVLIASGGMVINEDSADFDFRVESNGNEYALFVDGGADKTMFNTSYSADGGVVTIRGTYGANNASDYRGNNALALTGADPGTTAAGSGINLAFVPVTNRGATAVISGENVSTNKEGGAQLRFSVGGGAFPTTQKDTLMLNYDSGAIFNEGSADLDFRVESDSNTHMLFVDAGTNRVGINDSAPDKSLHVSSAGTAEIRVQNSTNSYALDLGMNDELGQVKASANIALLPGGAEKWLIDSSGNVTQTNTSGGSGSGPYYDLHRDSGSPAANDLGPIIRFRGDNSAGGVHTYANIYTQFTDVTDAGEDCTVHHQVSVAGTPRSVLSLKGNAEVSVNEESQNIDFRVESDVNTHALFVDAGSNFVGIMNSTDFGGALNVNGGLNSKQAVFSSVNNRGLALSTATRSGQNDGVAIVDAQDTESTGGRLELHTMGAERARFERDQIVFNEGSNDQDFRVESNDNANMIFVDAGSNRVGIGKAPLTNALDVSTSMNIEGDASPSGNGLALGDYGTTGSYKWIQSFNSQPLRLNPLGNEVSIGVSGTGANFKAFGNAVFNEDGGSTQDFRVESNSNTQALLVDAGGDFVAMGNTIKNPASGFSDQHGVGIDVQNGSVQIASDAQPLEINRTTTGGATGGFINFRKEGAMAYDFSMDANGMVFNEAGGDRDFRVESDSNTHALFVDAGNDAVLVGGTSITADEGGIALIPQASNVSHMYIGHATGTAGGNPYIYFRYGSGNIGSIAQSGTTAVQYNTTSDQRLKDNIVDAPSASDDIDAIQVRSFDWKVDGSHQKYGMVAQELVTVAPEAVTQPEDPEEMMGVDYSKLVPMLIKEIQSLRARVAQLESN